MTEMTPAEAVFYAALERPPGDRAAFVAAACGGDADLRARIEKMLAAQPDLEGFLDQPPGLPARPDPPRWRGAVIAGRYKLLQEVGEGGMGTVWMADQLEPVRRRVAVKLIRTDHGRSADILVRFEAERQAIALMDHPHIAKLLDAGTTGEAEAATVGAGRPYFVMELVRGVPLNAYCDEHQLSVPERLRLFLQICSAVQHAHQKGVIHRDLKPSNILVESHDGKPVPRVIDFGLAKAAGGLRLTENTLFTRLGTVAGTPQYMAPEQATFNALDIDTRADVYALGVILYELLTGTTPLSREAIKKAQIDEMLRLIREQDAPAPSSRLSSGDAAPAVAANRQTEPARLGRLVKGDLDWIVLKALAKERDRRYESATGFATDVERFLNHEPVLAGPPGAAYRFRKFVRRHRPQVIAAGVVLVALIAGVVGTTLGLIEARRQERIARGQRDVAEARLAKLENGVEILGSVFENLDPRAEKRGGDSLGVALGKQLDRAANELKGDAVGDPLVVARLQGTLGTSLVGLGRYDKAIEVLESATATRAELLGDEHKDTLLLRIGLANAYLQGGQTQRAIALFDRAVPGLAQHLGADHPTVLKSRAERATALVGAGRLEEAAGQLASVLTDYQAGGLGEDRRALIAWNMLAYAYLKAGQSARAIPVLERILPVCEAKLGTDDPDALIVRNNMAMAYHEDGQYARCVPLQQRTYEALVAKLGDKHPITLTAQLNLVKANTAAGRAGDAVPILERLREIRDAVDGPNDPSTLVVYTQLGVTYIERGDHKRAIPLLEKALENARSLPNKDGSDEVIVRGNLAVAYDKDGQYARAIPLYETNIAIRQKHPDRDPASLVNERSNLAAALGQVGEFDRAVGVLEQNLGFAETKLRADHPMTLNCRHILGRAYRNAGQPAKGLALHERNLPLAIGKLREEHPNILFFRVHLALARQETGDLATALPELKAAVDRAKQQFDPTHLETLRITQHWADALEQAKDFDRAIAERQGVLAVERKRGQDDLRLATALVKAGQTFLAAGRAAEALSPLREALPIQQRLEPDRWTTFATQSMLGEALSRGKEYSDAAPLLLAGHEGLQQRARGVPAQQRRCLTEAVERLVRHYEAAGNKDAAAKWRAALEKAGTP